MVKINTERTKEFAKRCNEASAELFEVLGELHKLHDRMALSQAPARMVDFEAANREADDLGDVAYIAATLVLDATGADNADIPARYRDTGTGIFDPVGAAINTAGKLEDGGDEGRKIRDRRNAHVTVLAMEAALRADSDIEVTNDGLIVAVRKRDMPIDLGEVGEYVGVDEVEVPISARGGTTYGNVFITTSDKPVNLDEFDQPTDQKTKDLLEHEGTHTYQWAAAGAKSYPLLYLWESRHDPEVKIKTKKVKVKGPFGIEYEVEVPTGVEVDMEPDDVACDNRFEQDADLKKGGYTCGP